MHITSSGPRAQVIDLPGYAQNTLHFGIRGNRKDDQRPPIVRDLTQKGGLQAIEGGGEGRHPAAKGSSAPVPVRGRGVGRRGAGKSSAAEYAPSGPAYDKSGGFWRRRRQKSAFIQSNYERFPLLFRLAWTTNPIIRLLRKPVGIVFPLWLFRFVDPPPFTDQAHYSADDRKRLQRYNDTKVAAVGGGAWFGLGTLTNVPYIIEDIAEFATSIAKIPLDGLSPLGSAIGGMFKDYVLGPLGHGGLDRVRNSMNSGREGIKDALGETPILGEDNADNGRDIVLGEFTAEDGKVVKITLPDVLCANKVAADAFIAAITSASPPSCSGTMSKAEFEQIIKNELVFDIQRDEGLLQRDFGIFDGSDKGATYVKSFKVALPVQELSPGATQPGKIVFEVVPDQINGADYDGNTAYTFYMTAREYREAG